jgi:hypothetical protein
MVLKNLNLFLTVDAKGNSDLNGEFPFSIQARKTFFKSCTRDKGNVVITDEIFTSNSDLYLDDSYRFISVTKESLLDYKLLLYLVKTFTNDSAVWVIGNMLNWPDVHKMAKCLYLVEVEKGAETSTVQAPELSEWETAKKEVLYTIPEYRTINESGCKIIKYTKND